MTKDEILAMEAGRELDALIVDKVMGWAWNTHNPRNHIMWNPDTGGVGIVVFHDGGEGDGVIQVLDVPYYSSDIAAAWEVIGKMIEQGTFINLGHGGLVWRVNISTRYMYERLEFEGITAESAPLAICRAALVATLEAE